MERPMLFGLAFLFPVSSRERQERSRSRATRLMRWSRFFNYCVSIVKSLSPAASKGKGFFVHDGEDSVLRTGEPPARVPRAETVHRTVSAPLLRLCRFRISPTAVGDQRRCLWISQAFEKA